MPSSAGSARVMMSPRVEPACGSESASCRRSGPRASAARTARPARGCRAASSRLALATVRKEYAAVPMLAAVNHAMQAEATTCGSCSPPSSSSSVSAEQVGLGERLQRCLDLRDQLHRLAVEGRLLGVALAVVRREVLGRELLAQLQHGVERLAGVLGEARAARLSSRRPATRRAGTRGRGRRGSVEVGVDTRRRYPCDPGVSARRTPPPLGTEGAFAVWHRHDAIRSRRGPLLPDGRWRSC